MQSVVGFSKIDKDQKIEVVQKLKFKDQPELASFLESFCHPDEQIQNMFEQFSENTISNFHLPYSVIPNFNLNNRDYVVPIAIEESSVVAAACKSSGFWKSRGGFHAAVVSTIKVGQIHFFYGGDDKKLLYFFEAIKNDLLSHVKSVTSNMEKRGGGITDIVLMNKSSEEKDYYQLKVYFETCDAMGANFINTALELLSEKFQNLIKDSNLFNELSEKIDVIMAITSNYTPECLVRAWVECDIKDLDDGSLGMTPEEFASKFSKAIRIAKVDRHRATTHNKGIYNGIDGVIIATGNDFRSVEASGHSYASRDGKYRGLTDISLEDGIFYFSLEIPLALGTVGGITSLHPLAKTSLEMLGNPTAEDLMEIVASVGLAQNFAAVKSLITKGIQKGHMRMHLINLLTQFEASQEEKKRACEYFKDQIISFAAVREFFSSIRKQH